MIDEQKALSRRAVACPKWRWLPGMLAVELAGPGKSLTGGRPVRVDDCWHAVNVWRPVLTDPATLGCLLALVREAWGQDDLGAFRVIVGQWCTEVTPQEGQHHAFYGSSEAEALVAALESAP